jgi:hypothetical protein
MRGTVRASRCSHGGSRQSSRPTFQSVGDQEDYISSGGSEVGI